MLRSLPVFLAVLSIASGFVSCGKDDNMEFRKFVDDHTSRVSLLEKQGSLAYWEASRSGREEDFLEFSRSQMELEKIYTSREDFEYIKEFRADGRLKDPVLRRIADILYLKYLGNQVDPAILQRIVDLSGRIDNLFSVYRPVVDGKEMTTNEVYTALRESTDGAYRKKVWEASKSVGPVVIGDLMELVRARNEAARAAGFENYYRMSMTLSEQDEGELAAVFEELERLTREPFLAMKRELDAELAKRYGIDPEEMRPWHYQDPYFQEAPSVGEVDFDAYYKGRDIAELATVFYAGLGMPVEDIISRSDLYERAGKNPHAFCTNIDRSGDIRILCNLVDNGQWMETMLHELGHGVYDKYIDMELPWLLRTFPHLCLTEASAMFFGRLSQDQGWMKAALGLGDEEAARIAPALKKSLRAKQLVFARWVQVMFNFERELYRDPDQDLNALWWDLKEKYQFVKRPEGRDEPDFAAKIHIISSPAYYHNYMLGEMIASQLGDCLKRRFAGGGGETGVYGNRAVGDFFREVVYGPGNILPWDEHVEKVTGEPLSAKYFVAQFVEEKD